jgi:hypothetical protein
MRHERIFSCLVDLLFGKAWLFGREIRLRWEILWGNLGIEIFDTNPLIATFFQEILGKTTLPKIAENPNTPNPQKSSQKPPISTDKIQSYKRYKKYISLKYITIQSYFLSFSQSLSQTIVFQKRAN